MTVLTIGSQWPTLDPAGVGAQPEADYNYNNEIYGQLFEFSPGGTVVPDLATKYAFSNHNLTVTITIRSGVKFSDGTPYTAQDVASSISRDLNPVNVCDCDPDFAAVQSITTSGDKVLLHLSQPSASIINAFNGESPNWTIDPTAFAADGAAKYGQDPIGAGPFVVQSNEASAELVLSKNPGYWEPGHPYLSSMTFLTVSSEQSAYDALESGSAQAVEGIVTSETLDQAKANPALKVYTAPGVSANWIEINTKVAPFNNILAREAIYYATDSSAILRVLAGRWGQVTESPSGAGGLFYEPKVPGYRTYNLAKAKALVAKLGGLSFTLMGENTSSGLTLDEALESEWQAAGMTVTLQQISLAQVIANYESNSWQISPEAGGEYDPNIGVQGLGTRVKSGGKFSCCDNAALDGLINKAGQLISPSARENLYHQIFKTISDEAYGPYLYVALENVVATRAVKGLVISPGFEPVVQWENVSV